MLYGAWEEKENRNFKRYGSLDLFLSLIFFSFFNAEQLSDF
jgi:hypothetical protein